LEVIVGGQVLTRPPRFIALIVSGVRELPHCRCLGIVWPIQNDLAIPPDGSGLDLTRHLREAMEQ
jgi:hypothetical protein